MLTIEQVLTDVMLLVDEGKLKPSQYWELSFRVKLYLFHEAIVREQGFPCIELSLREGIRDEERKA